jgi:predicted ATPase/DNA-binding SARP family transcriptional activator
MDLLWRIELFGWLRAAGTPRVVDHVVRRFQTQKTASLLAYLSYFRERSHPREALIELLWPESPVEAGRNRLKVALSSLRHQLEPPGIPRGAVILADRVSVQLNPAACSTDVVEFRVALQEAEAGGGSARVQHLVDAARLYRGELLPGYFDRWVLEERPRLADAYRQALQQLARLLRNAGDLPRAIDYARRMVATDPLSEESHYELIRLLAAAGQPEAALRQYQDLERLLAAELGEAPADDIRAFSQALRQAGSEAGRTRTAARNEIEEAHRKTDEAVERMALSTTTRPGPPPPLVLLPAGTVTLLLVEGEGAPAGLGGAARQAPGQEEQDCERFRSLFRGHGGHELQASGAALVVAFGRASEALAAAVAARRSASGAQRVRMALHTSEVLPGDELANGPALEHAMRLLLATHPGQTLLSGTTAPLLQQVPDPSVALTALGRYRLQESSSAEPLFQVDDLEMPRVPFSAPAALHGAEGNLPPQFTRFFGREEEIARLCEVLGPRLPPLGESGRVLTGCQQPKAAGPRLVTLTGPGGAGKTRLALQVAAALRETFQGAVWFVPLADVTDPQLIADKVREALSLPRTPGLEPLEQVVAVLCTQAAGRAPTEGECDPYLLLLLDNLEHLMPVGATLVQTLLERVETLSLLVTSRQRLDLPGELEFAVPPLPVPVDGQWLIVDGPAKPDPPDLSTINHQLSTLLQCPSVRLFVDRAQAVRPDFQVTKGNAAAVSALCRRLEGLPLAVELAAARAGVLTPAQMLDRLDQRFELLVSRGRRTDPRHRSLRAALDWSYQLLSPELRQFFAGVSLFRGGWTLEAAEVVCEERRALEYLAELQAGSLVFVTGTGGAEMRFSLLETLREYAAEQLDPTERTPLLCRHALFYLELAMQAERESPGTGQAMGFDRLEREHDNLRAALSWSVERGKVELGLRLAGALGRFWLVRGYLAEGRERLESLLSMPGAEARTTTRARALQCAGKLADEQGDVDAAQARLEECLAIWRELGDPPGIGSTLNLLGDVALYRGDPGRAGELYIESLTIHQEREDRRAIAISLSNLGNVATARGDYATARTLLDECLDISRQLGDKEILSGALHGLARIAIVQADLDMARSLLQESLAIRRELGLKPTIAASLSFLGDVAQYQGDYGAAQALYQESLAIGQETGNKPVIGWALSNLGDAALHQGDPGAARALYEHSLVIARELQNRWGIAGLLSSLGQVALREGDPQAARTLYGQSLALRLELGDQRFVAECLEGLAEVAGATGQPEKAVRILAAAAALRQAIGTPLPFNQRAAHEARLAALRTSLGEAGFDAAWKTGCRLEIQQAADLSLAEPG